MHWAASVSGICRETPLGEFWNNEEMQRMRDLHATRRAGDIDICRRCCATVPHPALVVGSLLVHGRTVRKLVPWFERLAYVSKWLTRLL